MMDAMSHGVSFAADADGRRSTTRAGRNIVADALRPVDPVGALGRQRGRGLTHPREGGAGGGQVVSLGGENGLGVDMGRHPGISDAGRVCQTVYQSHRSH